MALVSSVRRDGGAAMARDTGPAVARRDRMQRRDDDHAALRVECAPCKRYQGTPVTTWSLARPRVHRLVTLPPTSRRRGSSAWSGAGGCSGRENSTYM